MLLHKLRRAMVNAGREPLHGDVEIDDTWIGGPQAGLQGSRQLRGRRAALVLVAVEKRGTTSGRVRMAVIPDFKARTLTGFIAQHIALGSTIYTDGLKQFTGLPNKGYGHVPRTQPRPGELRRGAKSVVPLADRAIGNLQQWLVGTHHGVSRGQLQVYLDEFVFRHNRRRTPAAAFQTLLGLGMWARAHSLSTDSGRQRPDGDRRRLIATYGGYLKQPDKQETSRVPGCPVPGALGCGVRECLVPGA